MPKSTQTSEVMIIGSDFIPGAQANSEIDSLLGYNTCMLDDKAIRSEEFGCVLSPDYCGELEPTQEALAALDLDPLILPTLYYDDKKRKTKHPDSNSPYFFSASFTYDDEHFMTQPFDTEELALSCALWYVLAYHS